MSKVSSKVLNENKQGMLSCLKFCPKIDLEVGISKIEVQIRNQLLQDTMCADF